jgi:hypothetical protein
MKGKGRFWALVSIYFLLVCAWLQFTPVDIIYECFVRPRISAAGTITDLTGTTGLVGKEDISWGTGLSTDTYTVTGYDASVVTLTKLPSLLANGYSIIKGKWYVAVSATIADHGAASGADYTAGNLKKVVDVIGATDIRGIRMPAGEYPLLTSLSVGSNISLIPDPGALVKPAAAKSLTLQSPAHLVLSLRQRFIDMTSNATNPLLFTTGGKIAPDLFAPNTTPGTTDMYAAIAAADTSLGANAGTVCFVSGAYKLATSHTFDGAIVAYFEHNGSTIAPDTTKSLTVNSPEHVRAQPRQKIKTGAGTLAFTSGGQASACWWGFGESGATATENGDRMDEAMTAVGTAGGGVVHVPTVGTVTFDTFSMQPYVTLQGLGKQATVLSSTYAGACVVLASDTIIRDIGFDGVSRVTPPGPRSITSGCAASRRTSGESMWSIANGRIRTTRAARPACGSRAPAPGIPGPRPVNSTPAALSITAPQTSPGSATAGCSRTFSGRTAHTNLRLQTQPPACTWWEFMPAISEATTSKTTTPST